MTNSPVPQRRDTRITPMVFALGLVVLAVVVTITWAITWSVAGKDDSASSSPTPATVEPAPEAEVVDTVRATTESLYNFTPDTINATVKTAQATLCGDALNQWNETAKTLPGIVADTGRSVGTSNAHYGIVDLDETTATVLALFVLDTTENNTPAAPATTAVEFTVQRTAVPMCISSMEVL
ncbi:hypothetical protein [Williamsia sp.]|uniref:hypothetical protein n=1 Tax=Williamsia sp. TaxID=1872085 RepID=UPI002F93062D